MNALVYLLHFPWVEPLGRALLHFLWQGTLVGLLAAVLQHGCAPARRHAIAVCALLLCTILPPVTFFVLLPRTSAPLATVTARSEQPATPITMAAAPAPEMPLPQAKEAGPMPPPSAPAEARAESASVSLTRLAVSIWAIGVSLLGLRFAIGWLRVQLWRNGAAPLLAGPIGERFASLARQLGLARRRARLLLTPATSLASPLVVGVLRPVVLLPARVLEALPLEQIEALLAHELAHLQRYDYLWNLLASAIEVALFYHPAIWFLSRSLRTAAEEACDDLATSLCPSRLDYARALTSLAESATPALALAATGRPLLARVRRVLGLPPAPIRRTRNAGWVLALASVVLAAAGILHSGRALAQEADDETDPTVPVVTQSALHGTVLDPAGQPVPNARVLVLYTRDSWSPDNRIYEETRTGADGRYAFSKALHFHNPDAAWDPAEYALLAYAPAFAPAWRALGAEDAAEADQPLKLGKPVRRTFTVLDHAKQPLPGAIVRLENASRGRAQPGIRDQVVLSNPIGVCEATTDAQGVATIENLPSEAFLIVAGHDGFGDKPIFAVKPEGTTITLEAASVLEGRVTDPLGRPVAGALISLTPRFKYFQRFTAKTDAQGHYRVAKIWSDREANPSDPDWGHYEVSLRHPAFTAPAREVDFAAGQQVAGFDFKAEPGTELRGRLLDPQTHAPVVDASVQVDSLSGRLLLRTGIDGVFHGRVMPGDMHAFLTGAPRHGYYAQPSFSTEFPQMIQANVGGETKAFTLYLPGPLGKLGAVRGEVKLPDGSPAAHCLVTPMMEGDRLQTGRWSGNELPGVTTDTHGAFVLTGVPIGPRFTIVAHANDGANGTGAGQLTAPEFQLPAAITLQPAGPGGEVLLTDLAGKPLVNFRVHLEQMVKGDAVSMRGELLSTDAQGVLKLAQVIPGLRYRISSVVELSSPNARIRPEDSPIMKTAQRLVRQMGEPAKGLEAKLRGLDPLDDWAQCFYTVPATPPAERPVLTLDSKAKVRLLDPTGEPMSVKRILRYEAHTVEHGQPSLSPHSVPVEGKAGPDAIILWRHLMAQRDVADFTIETDDGWIVRGSGKLPEDGTNVMVVRAQEMGGRDTAPDATVPGIQAGWVTGRVVTPEGEPIAGASLEMPGTRADASKQPKIETDAQGLFRFAHPGVLFSYTRISKPGWAAALVTDLPVGIGFRVALRKDGGLRGKVAGAEGAITIALKKTKFSHNELFQFEVPDVEVDFTTDAQGNYDQPVEPGHYRWEAANAAKTQFARGEVEVVAGKWAELAASLGGGCTVTLELVDCESGKPVPGIEVGLNEVGQNRRFVERAESKQTSDAEGHIRWENVAPGEKQIVSPRMWRRGLSAAQEPYSRWWRAEEPVAARRIDYAQAKPTLSQGTTPLNLEATPGMAPIRILLERGAKLTGQVLTPEGKPAAAVFISAVMHSGLKSDGLPQFGVPTDAQGHYVLYLPAGNGVTYSLYAGFRVGDTPPGTTGAPAISEAFEVKSGEEREIVLRQPVGGWLTGRVVSATGTLPEKVKVIARSQDPAEGSGAMRMATVDATGHFRVGPLRVGRYKVETAQMEAMRFIFDPAASLLVEIKTDGQTVEMADVTFGAKAE